MKTVDTHREDGRRVVELVREIKIKKKFRMVAPTTDETTLGYMLWAHRARLELDLRAVKETTGVSVPTLYRLETTNRCDLLTFVSICPFLGISFEAGAIALKLIPATTERTRP